MGASKIESESLNLSTSPTCQGRKIKLSLEVKPSITWDRATCHTSQCFLAPKLV